MLKSKKGITITILVLIAITVASFSVWQIPDNPKMTIVITDFESHLEGIDARHEIITSAIEGSFSKLMNEKMSPEEWQESYINRITSLKSFEAYIIETMVMAEFHVDGDGDLEQKDDLLDKIEKLKEESIQYAQMADSSKP